MATDARAALVRLQESIDGGTLDADLERLGVSVLSAFGSATRPGGEPADLDIGVRFSGPARLLEIIDLLVTATGYDRIDAAVITGDQPVLDAEALFGIGLYEAERGAYANAQMAALGHRWDTAKFRDLDVQLLAR